MSGGRPQRGRRARKRVARGESVAGRRVELTCGPIAHGGDVVARLPEGDSTRVVFVRHALPGERVEAELTEGFTGDRFWRADAVQVIEPSPDRVSAPCRYAGPGGCGGCDLQHVSPAGQRELKAAVVEEQLSRLAGIDRAVKVEEVPGGPLGWRTRMQYVDLGAGRRGLHRHRSHEVMQIEECLIAGPGSAEPGTTERVVAAGRSHDFAVAEDGFWQPHREAPQVLVETVLGFAQARPGETVLDLYAGVGLFSRFLLDEVAPEGVVLPVEGDRAAARLAAENVGAEVFAGDVQEFLESEKAAGTVELVVLDPPRVGAKRRVVEGIVRCAPRTVVHVACDPAALARDVALFAEHGYLLRGLRAFDLFPMTHHVECVARLARS